MFHADYFQFELLSTRPQLLSGSSFNFPHDILSFSCCDSIGTYGVFYVDNTKSIDLAYCCASLLAASLTPNNYGQISVDLTFPQNSISVSNCHCNACSELNYTYDIDFFTNNLLQLNIGSELEYYPQILSYVKSALRRLKANPVVSDLITFVDGLNIDTNIDETVNESWEGSPNILIINVDEKASR